MEFKIELKTRDGKPVPPNAKLLPTEESCQIMVEAILHQRAKELEEQQKQEDGI